MKHPKFVQLTVFPESEDNAAMLVGLDIDGEVWYSGVTENGGTWNWARWDDDKDWIDLAGGE